MMAQEEQDSEERQAEQVPLERPAVQETFFDGLDAEAVLSAFAETDTAGRLEESHMVKALGLLNQPADELRQTYQVLKGIDPQRAGAMARVLKRENVIDLEPGGVARPELVPPAAAKPAPSESPEAGREQQFFNNLGSAEEILQECESWANDEEYDREIVDGIINDVDEVTLRGDYPRLKQLDPTRAQFLAQLVLDERGIDLEAAPGVRSAEGRAAEIGEGRRRRRESAVQRRETLAALGFTDWNHPVGMINDRPVSGELLRTMDNDQLKIALTNLSRETPLTSVREAIAKIAAADDEGKIARTRMLRVVDGMIKGRRPATTESTKNPESGSVTERVKVALSNSGMDKYLDAAAIVELRPPQEAELLQQVKLDLMAGSLDAEKFTRENGLIAVANKYLKLPVFSEVATSLVNAVQRSEGEPPDRYIQEILTAIDESITNPDKRQNWNATARRYLNESTTIIEREGSNKAAVDNFAEAIRQQKGQYPIVETMIKFLAELARLEKRPPERQQ